MFSLIPCVAMICAQTPSEPLGWLIGSWTGSLSQRPLERVVKLKVSRQGTLIYMELERSDILMGDLKEKIVFDPARTAGFAVSDAPYAPTPRRDRVALGRDAISFVSDPWNIGGPDLLRLEWSLQSGRFEPGESKGRIFVAGPKHVADSNAVTLVWSGKLGDHQLGIDMGTLRRVAP